MQPASKIPASACRRARVVFTDIDDTLSNHGKLLPQAFEALWRLHDAGVAVVPVTGRCAGWVDHVARFWPVAGVVGENGALYFYFDEGARKLRKRYYFPPEEAARKKAALDAIRDEVLSRFPQLAVASDQPYREFDLAIDFCEDVPPQPWEVVEEVVATFRRHGANTKVSSIHVNGWFGDFDKLKTCKLFAGEVLGMDLEGDPAARDSCFFCGDSANDDPMFAFFPNSVGVANVRKFLSRLTHAPAYVTDGEGGLGFAEFVDALLAKRR
ncbi:MAG: HAD-IIB family hydrolase [Promethearchaeota archaeon]